MQHNERRGGHDPSGGAHSLAASGGGPVGAMARHFAAQSAATANKFSFRRVFRFYAKKLLSLLVHNLLRYSTGKHFPGCLYGVEQEFHCLSEMHHMYLRPSVAKQGTSIGSASNPTVKATKDTAARARQGNSTPPGSSIVSPVMS